MDRRLYLKTGQPDVIKRAVIETVQACNGGPAAKVVRSRLAGCAKQPNKCSGPLRGGWQNDG